MQLFEKIKKILRRGFRATLNFQKFKVALNALRRIFLNSNLFPYDCTVCWYHDVDINKYRVVIMTHQTLSLEKYWKLFPATLIWPNLSLL